MIFKPEDFENRDTAVFFCEPGDAQLIADIANTKLKEWIKDAPVVLGCPIDGKAESTWWSTFLVEGEDPCTHKAFLVGMEELKK